MSTGSALWGAFHVMSGRRLGDRYPREMNHAYRSGVVYRSGEYVVLMASAFAPYARTLRAGRSYEHLVRAVYIAWRRERGRRVPAGRLVVTWCGHGLKTATLSTEPGCAHRACRLCLIRTGEIRCCDVRGCCR